MPFITVDEENSGNVEIYYEDHGTGQPVVLSHGWPLSGSAWEKQVPVLLDAGYRVLTYDRRGFGQSSKPALGYDYDTFAVDLNKLILKLDLRNVALVGHSMGSGEVAGYLGKYASEQRVSKAVFISALPPFLLKTADNPDGVDGSVFDGIKKAIAMDRLAFLTEFLNNFYNFDETGGKLVSNQVVQYNWNVAAGASPKGTLDCVSAWLTDFRGAVSRINVPSLIIHGDADRIFPINATAIPLSKRIKGARLVVIEGGPHGIAWTHADQVNRELLAFLGEEALATQEGAAGR